jgi:DnaJ-class molecular chaperone
METNKNLYDVLGVDKNATDEELKKAYREKAKESHPDKGGSHEDTAEITNAYAILKNPAKRKEYDETGKVNANNFEQRFFAFVGDTLMKIIEANHDVEVVDIVQQFKDFIAAIVKDAESKKSELEKKLSKAEKVKSRLTTEAEENKLDHILFAHITELKKQVVLMDNEVKFIKDCAEVLEAYGYKVDQKPRNSHQWEPVHLSFGGSGL